MEQLVTLRYFSGFTICLYVHSHLFVEWRQRYCINQKNALFVVRCPLVLV